MQCKYREVKIWSTVVDPVTGEITKSFRISNECGKKVVLSHSQSKCRKCKKVIDNGTD